VTLLVQNLFSIALNIHPVTNKRFYLFFPVAITLLLLLSFNSPAGDLSHDVLKYTNEYRKSKGLSALVMRNDLNVIAQKHSADMASGKVGFGHDGFGQRQAAVQRLIKPWRGMAENVAYGVRTGKEVVAMWKRSATHRQNLLGKYTFIGIGTARDRKGRVYYTQIFVR
jgi:uncharacterized protein YkwD